MSSLQKGYFGCGFRNDARPGGQKNQSVKLRRLRAAIGLHGDARK